MTAKNDSLFECPTGDTNGHYSSHRGGERLPPDLISVSTASRDDDSVSSLSTSEVCGARRTLFPEHWQKSCRSSSFHSAAGTNKTSIVTCCSNEQPILDDDSSCSDNTYERVLKKQEGVIGKSSQRRRILFQRGNSFDLQSPSYYARNPSIWRQSYSDSALVVNKSSSSCLRPCKYSGNNGPFTRRSERHRVSFSNDDTVVKFTIPKEQWASSGWSSYFY